jgi:hypothetical protein
MLLEGAFGYFRNELAHRRVFYDDPMYAKEVVLLGDLLLRELREIGSDIKLQQLQAPAHNARDARMTERGVRGLTPLEFQKWVVRRFGGTYAPQWSGDMGIDGYTFGYELPIQAKQQDSVGRKVVDEFETAIERSGKSRGFLVALGFTKTAYVEAARSTRTGRVDVELVTAKELIRSVPS